MYLNADINTSYKHKSKAKQCVVFFCLTHSVQILCEQRHTVLLPQGIRGFPAEVDGSLRGVTLQGETFNFEEIRILLQMLQCCVFVCFCQLIVFFLQNSPNDLQMLSDAPAHHLFCLLPPVPPTQNSLPEVLAVVQVRRLGSLVFRGVDFL